MGSTTGLHGCNLKRVVPALVGFNLPILLKCSFTSEETHKHFSFLLPNINVYFLCRKVKLFFFKKFY